MKKLAYIATIACSMFLTTSCVDLTQEPQSFITDEDYIASMDLTGLQQAATGLYNDLWNGNYGFNCRLQRINVCADDIDLETKEEKEELIRHIYELAVHTRGQRLTVEDQMIALSTCSSGNTNGRHLLICKVIKENTVEGSETE